MQRRHISFFKIARDLGCTLCFSNGLAIATRSDIAMERALAGAVLTGGALRAGTHLPQRRFYNSFCRGNNA